MNSIENDDGTIVTFELTRGEDIQPQREVFLAFTVNVFTFATQLQGIYYLLDDAVNRLHQCQKEPIDFMPKYIVCRAVLPQDIKCATDDIVWSMTA